MGVLDNDYAVMIAAPGTFRDVAEQKIQNFVLQQAADQQQIADLKQQLADITAKELGDKLAIADLQVQISALQNTVVYRDLEFNAWSQNSDAIVGGSGKGTASQKPPAADGWAEFSIAPVVGNYFDCYYTKTHKADDSKRSYRLKTDWKFETAADAAASQCLEMEARPIITGGLMFVIACQLDFADKQLRYWAGPDGKWQASGTPQARLTPGTAYTVILDGHRDDLTVFHDSISINGVVTKLGTSYPAFNRGWGAALKCSLQLDGNGKGDPYKVKYRNAVYSAA